METKIITSFSSIQITLDTQEEIDQLYAILNFIPIYDVISSGSCNWKVLRNLLNDHQKGYVYWHNKLRKKFDKS